MPARRGGVPFASSQSNNGVKFIDTRGEPTLGIVVCQRCQTKRKLADVIEDGNIKKFYVCKPEISRGCWDQYDPFRLPAPPPDDYRLPFVRPDTNIAIEPDGLPPLEPPPQDA